MKPGTSVQKDETYKAFPTAKRRHWETGDNNDLTEAQKKKWGWRRKFEFSMLSLCD